MTRSRAQGRGTQIPPRGGRPPPLRVPARHGGMLRRARPEGILTPWEFGVGHGWARTAGHSGDDIVYLHMWGERRAAGCVSMFLEKPAARVTERASPRPHLPPTS